MQSSCSVCEAQSSPVRSRRISGHGLDTLLWAHAQSAACLCRRAGCLVLTSSSSAAKPTKTMDDMKNLTPAAALRKLKKLDRQIAELAQKAADGAELTADQKAKLEREGDVKRMLVDAEKAAVKAAFAAPQLVIRQAPQQPKMEAEVMDNHAEVDGDKDGPAKEEATAATKTPLSSSSIPASTPAVREGGFLAAGATSGMDPVSIWYTAVANWIRSKPSSGTGLGKLILG